MTNQHTKTLAALNRAAKWRTLLAGWQLGTRSDVDPECAAVRDHRDATTMLRIESTAIAALLIDKGVITENEWDVMLERAAAQYETDMEARFPGVHATDLGLSFDARATEWMRPPRWRP